MTTIGQRVKAARKFRDLSQAELVAKLKAEAGKGTQGLISQLENDQNAETTLLPAIARILHVSITWLDTGEGEMLQPNDKVASLEIDLENNPDYPAIRRVRFKLSAGTSGFGVDYDGTDKAAPIVFAKAWYASRNLDPSKLFAVKVANGSMESGLYDGDTVVVNTAQATPKDGVVFAVNFEGQLVIKRLQRDAGEWWLSSDNSDQRRYPRKICDENTFIIGEIVHKQSERI